ncbi:MAG: hypothetical protein EON59_02930 [Alphaproteobacteria bacterium]|nr:MAG: hypothetical protein EON59_02930 [Alphaproteobacteria bacterium]
MIPLMFAAALSLSQTQPAQSLAQPSSERIGGWEIRTRVDVITDEVSVATYFGNLTEGIAVACFADSPASTSFHWISATHFLQTALVPRNGDEWGAAGMPVGSTTFRFDQEAPVSDYTTVLDGRTTRFFKAASETIAARIASSSRLTLRDDVNRSHVAVFELVPADTRAMLRRLDAVCGTSLVSGEAAS